MRSPSVPGPLLPNGGAVPPRNDEPPATRSPVRLVVALFLAPLVVVLLLARLDVPSLFANWIAHLLR